LTIRVTPGSRRAGVGGERDGALVVRVRERAVEGRATEAALSALADALDVPRRAVTLVHGATSRTKVVDVEGDDERLEARVAALTSGR
jgi:uncharacterized protein YggU (UPF0235/DUF167 family)